MNNCDKNALFNLSRSDLKSKYFLDKIGNDEQRANILDKFRLLFLMWFFQVFRCYQHSRWRTVKTNPAKGGTWNSEMVIYQFGMHSPLLCMSSKMADNQTVDAKLSFLSIQIVISFQSLGLNYYMISNHPIIPKYGMVHFIIIFHLSVIFSLRNLWIAYAGIKINPMSRCQENPPCLFCAT